MKTEVHEAGKNALSVQFTALARPTALPALPVPRRKSVLVKSVAPEFQAEQVRVRIAAEKERARKNQQRRMSQQRATQRAVFSTD